MNKLKKYMQLAVKQALKKDKNNSRRGYLLGAVGIRADGVTVFSRNLPNQEKNPCNHAETLLCRKLDFGSTVFVARVNRWNQICNSRPCPSCRRNMANRGVKKCYYSISNNEIGVLTF